MLPGMFMSEDFTMKKTSGGGHHLKEIGPGVNFRKRHLRASHHLSQLPNCRGSVMPSFTLLPLRDGGYPESTIVHLL